MNRINFRMQKSTYKLGYRYIIHSSTSSNNKKKEPDPVKLAYVSYEDTNSRDIENKNKPPPLIIMHGLFGSKNNWNSLCKVMQKKLNPSRKIIAIDARNHGDSPHSDIHTYPALAADVRSLLEIEKIPQVTFMGHSMGGRTGMYLALQYPQIVDHLIVVDVSPSSNSKTFPLMQKYFQAMASVYFPKSVPLSAARAAANAALMASVPDKGIRTFLLTNLVQESNGNIKWRLNIRSLKDNYNNILKLPVEHFRDLQFLGPTTFIAGSESDFIREEDYPLIRKLFPKVQFHIISKAGHWLHSEKPDEFLEIVLKTLNTGTKV